MKEEEELKIPELTKTRPFRGMLSFQDNPTDQKIFGGREKEGKTLVETIKTNVLTVFYGHSGTGKTSLLNAYAIPQLRDEGYIPVYIRLSYDRNATVRVTLTDQVKQALLSNDKWKENHPVEFRVASGSPDGIPGETLWEYFTKYSATEKKGVPILIFDAFEEIFTLGADHEKEVGNLILELHHLIEHQFPKLPDEILSKNPELLITSAQKFRVLITIREDYLPQLNRLKNKIYSIDKAKVGLDDIGIATVGSIIHKIQDWCEMQYFDNACIELLKKYLKEELTKQEGGRKAPVSITLGLICYQLNERRIKAKVEKIDTKWLTEVEIKKQIGEYYSESVKDRKDRKIIEEELINKHGYRLSVPEKFLIEDKKLKPETLRRLVEDRRILRYEKRLGNTDVEIVHDSLAKKILEQRREREDLWRTQKIALAIAATAVLIIGAFAFTQSKIESETTKAEETAKLRFDSMTRAIDSTIRISNKNIETIRIAYLDTFRENKTKQQIIDEERNARMDNIIRKARQDSVLLGQRLDYVKETSKRIQDSTQRVAFARLMATSARGNRLAETARTEALIAYDTLKGSRFNMEDNLFPWIYEAMVSSMLDSIRTRGVNMITTSIAKLTGARVLKGPNNDYYYSISQHTAVKRNAREKTKLRASTDVRTWIGPTRERVAALTDREPTRFGLRILRPVAKNSSFSLSDNENVESLLFVGNEDTVILSTRNFSRPGSLYMITPDTLLEIPVELDTNEFLMLDYAGSKRIVAVSSKGKYFKPRSVSSKPFGEPEDIRVGRTSRVTCISHSTRRQSTLIGLDNGQVHEISGNVESRLFNNFEGARASRVTAISVSDNGNWVAVGYYKGSLILLDTESSKYAEILPNTSLSGDSRITSVFFLEKDRFIAAASDDASFYHIPTSMDYMKQKLCADGVLWQSQDWEKYIRQKIQPRDLCKPLK